MDYCTTKLLGLENVLVNNVNVFSSSIEIALSTKPKPSVCPCCGHTTKYVHDYRLQRIKDIPYNGKSVRLLLRKRRYVCPCCKKKFFEKYPFLPKYYHMTQRVYINILNDCREVYSYKSIALRYGVSTNTVGRVISIYDRHLYTCPQVISIDEFKGNAGDKYQSILADPKKGKVLDILRNRDSNTLLDYFKALNGRERVKVFISDMYKPYRDIAKIFFPKAKYVIDKYHYVRQVYWAVDRVRKKIQKNFNKERRIYFKHSKKLIFADSSKLGSEDRIALDVILSSSDELYLAWLLKEEFKEFRKCRSSTEGARVLRRWIEIAKESKLEEFKDCITAFTNWFEYICNSLDVPYTNGFIEGKNNKIKVLKRNAYGVRNFERFRKRILLSCG